MFGRCRPRESAARAAGRVGIFWSREAVDAPRAVRTRRTWTLDFAEPSHPRVVAVPCDARLTCLTRHLSPESGARDVDASKSSRALTSTHPGPEAAVAPIIVAHLTARRTDRPGFPRLSPSERHEFCARPTPATAYAARKWGYAALALIRWLYSEDARAAGEWATGVRATVRLSPRLAACTDRLGVAVGLKRHIAPSVVA